MSDRVQNWERTWRVVWPWCMGALAFLVLASQGTPASPEPRPAFAASRLAPVVVALVVIGFALVRSRSAKPERRTPSAIALGVLLFGWLCFQFGPMLLGSWPAVAQQLRAPLWWLGLWVFAVGVGLSVRVSLRLKELPSQ